MKTNSYSYFWKEEKWICGVQDEVFLLLKIDSIVLEYHINILKTFFIVQPWQAKGLVISFKIQSPNFWYRWLGQFVSHITKETDKVPNIP